MSLVNQTQFSFQQRSLGDKYTAYKTRLYKKLASYIIRYCRYTYPNIITFWYLMAGIIGGYLLTLSKPYVLLALIIFYFKGAIDFADGPIARLQGTTSEFGKKFDEISGYIGTFCFYLGLGIYMGSWGTVLWVFMMCGFLKMFGIKISRAYIIDIIIFMVGVHLLLY